MSDQNSPIGVFDSGLGGLTAIKQLKKLLPNETFVYFGDTGRVPYGTRSFETVSQYADDDMRFLMSFDIKAAIIACGTVSAIALPMLEKTFPLPVIGAIRPACAAALRSSKNGKIAVFATPATIGRHAFEAEIARCSADACVFPLACPMFVPLIEAGYIAPDCRVTRLIAAEYLRTLCGTGVDTLILGCTHYPIIRELIASVAEEVLGAPLKLIDSGYELALAAKALLTRMSLLRETEEPGSVRFFVSDEIQNFKTIAEMFLGEPVEKVTKVCI